MKPAALERIARERREIARLASRHAAGLRACQTHRAKLDALESDELDRIERRRIEKLRRQAVAHRETRDKRRRGENR